MKWAALCRIYTFTANDNELLRIKSAVFIILFFSKLTFHRRFDSSLVFKTRAKCGFYEVGMAFRAVRPTQTQRARRARPSLFRMTLYLVFVSFLLQRKTFLGPILFSSS